MTSPDVVLEDDADAQVPFNGDDATRPSMPPGGGSDQGSLPVPPPNAVLNVRTVVSDDGSSSVVEGAVDSEGARSNTPVVPPAVDVHKSRIPCGERLNKLLLLCYVFGRKRVILC